MYFQLGELSAGVGYDAGSLSGRGRFHCHGIPRGAFGESEIAPSVPNANLTRVSSRVGTGGFALHLLSICNSMVD